MKKENRKKLLTIVAVVCAVIFIACAGLLIWMHIQQQRVNQAIQNAVSSSTPPVSSSELPVSSDIEPVDLPDPVAIPVDFAALAEINTDIYAWLSIPGMNLELPVVTNTEENDYYLRRDIYRNYSSNGSLYSQYGYNPTPFDDACTIIYGHNMLSGAMFGNMQEYAQSLDLINGPDEQNCFTIYEADRALTYRFVQAGRISDDHVLYYYDFSIEESFNAFFDMMIGFPSGQKNVSNDMRPQFGEKIVILQTCDDQNDNYRYIMVGVLIDEHPALTAEQ